MKKSIAMLGLIGMCSFAMGNEPTYKQGVNIFIETGVTLPDNIPTWYAPMVAKPYAPVFEILATQSTRGRYYNRTYAVTLKDIIKWHSHDCEGLTHVANCSKIAFKLLFPDGIIDRSVLRAISGKSPCWSDGVAFLTGARIQYGNLGFFKDKNYDHAIIIYREDTKMAVLATWKEGINSIVDEPVVLPEKIKWKTKVDMQKIIELKKEVKKSKAAPSPYTIDLMRHYQWMHVNDILSRPLEESYQAVVLEDFKWEDWIDKDRTIDKTFKRSDIALKDYPYRKKPISKE